jgi:indolepyruvate ferredoxin oxidoreductase beta subunit
LREALRTTLADPEGKLNQAHRAASPKAQPIFWAPKAAPRETTVTPHA